MRLTEAKRRLQTDMTVYAIGYYNEAASGPRTVSRGGTTGFSWRNPTIHGGMPDHARPSWTAWPPARQTVDLGPDGILLMMENGRPMTALFFTEQAWLDAMADRPSAVPA